MGSDHHFVGDIACKDVLEAFAAHVLQQHDKVHYIINNALPPTKGIDQCSFDEFQYALSVGVTAPFYLVKLFSKHLADGASIINISSSRDCMSQPQTESYTAAKGGIAALTHALAVSLRGKARVNSISRDGSTHLSPPTQVPMPPSTLSAEWATLSTSPTWYCSSALRRRDSSLAKTSASMVA